MEMASCFTVSDSSWRARELANGAESFLGGRALDLLLVLISHAGETVNRDELFTLVWPDVIVCKTNASRAHRHGPKVLEDWSRGGESVHHQCVGQGIPFRCAGRASPAGSG